MATATASLDAVLGEGVNPFTYSAYDFRWTARWEASSPTILGRLNSLMEKLDWCRWAILHLLPSGAWDEPLELNGEYLWWDVTNAVFRYSATAPDAEDDGTELGAGGPGALPTGYYDDPFVVGVVYLWHDVTNDVLRVSKSAPTSTDDPDSGILGMGGIV